MPVLYEQAHLNYHHDSPDSDCMLTGETMILDTKEILSELQTYEAHRAELIGDDRDRLLDLRQEIAESKHLLALVEILAERLSRLRK